MLGLLTPLRTSPSMSVRSFGALICALAVVLAASGAYAEPVSGRVVDAHTGLPMVGLEITVEETGAVGVTDDQGRYAIEVGALEAVTLVPLVDGVPEEQAIRWVNQRPGTERVLRVFDPSSAPTDGMRWGAPLPSRPADPNEPDGSVELPGLPEPNPLFAAAPAQLPETIRVGRRDADTCVGHSIQRIETVPLEEYVQGVLIPEIGVFRAVEGGPESAAGVFEAFAVAARSYAVWWYLQNPDREYHIDDTACNQRYDDSRSAWVAERVAATQGQVMVDEATRTQLDKYEYAASCGEHGSRPFGQTALVPDVTPLRACVGSWCGHDGCAAHEENPDVEPAGNRCLVRGICQWGAIERSMEGDSGADILAHYQPNLAVVDLGATVEPPVDEDVADAGDTTDAAEPTTGDVADDTTLDGSGQEDTGPNDTGATPDIVSVDAPEPGSDSDTPSGDVGSRPRPNEGGGTPPPLFSVVDPSLEVGRGCATAPRDAGRFPFGAGVLIVFGAASAMTRRRPAT